MRIAIISNIHGNLPALVAVLASIDADEHRVERIVCAGDVVGLGPSPNEVVALLAEREIESVKGNYDDAVLHGRMSSGVDFPNEASETIDTLALEWTRRALDETSIKFLQGMPKDMRLSPGGGRSVRVEKDAGDSRTAEYQKSYFIRALAGGLIRPQPRASKRVLVVHGSPRALNEYIRESTANSILATIARDAQTHILVSGHAETGFRKDAHDVTFVGVGPVSPRTGVGLAEYAVVHMAAETNVDLYRVPYDVEEYERTVVARGMPQSLIRH